MVELNTFGIHSKCPGEVADDAVPLGRIPAHELLNFDDSWSQKFYFLLLSKTIKETLSQIFENVFVPPSNVCFFHTTTHTYKNILSNMKTMERPQRNSGQNI